MKDGSFLVLFKDDSRQEVFLIRRSDMPLWVLSGGGIDGDEGPEDAAVREAVEETGMVVKLIRKVGVYNIINNKGETTRKTYLFEGRIISGNFKPEFPGCLGDWFFLENLPKEITEATKMKILDAKNQPLNKIFTKSRLDSIR